MMWSRAESYTQTLIMGHKIISIEWGGKYASFQFTFLQTIFQFVPVLLHVY